MAFPMISYRELDNWREQGKAFMLIDLREPCLYERKRLWGSINIPFDEIEYRLSEVPRDYPVVFYCDRGPKSMVICRNLSRKGYRCVDLAGGMLQYRGKFIDNTPLAALE